MRRLVQGQQAVLLSRRRGANLPYSLRNPETRLVTRGLGGTGICSDSGSCQKTATIPNSYSGVVVEKNERLLAFTYLLYLICTLKDTS